MPMEQGLCPECGAELAVLDGRRVRQARWFLIDLLIPAFSVMLVAGTLVFLFDRGAWWAVKEETIQPPRYFLVLSGDRDIGNGLAPRMVTAWLAGRGADQITGPTRVPGANDQQIIDARVDGKPVQVMIRTAGTDAGFVDLSGSTADIAMATRPMGAEEARRGDLAGHVAEHLVGHEAVQPMLFDTAAAPINPEVASFIKFALSAPAQKLVAEAGFTSIARSGKHSG